MMNVKNRIEQNPAIFDWTLNLVIYVALSPKAGNRINNCFVTTKHIFSLRLTVKLYQNSQHLTRFSVQTAHLFALQKVPPVFVWWGQSYVSMFVQLIIYMRSEDVTSELFAWPLWKIPWIDKTVKIEISWKLLPVFIISKFIPWLGKKEGDIHLDLKVQRFKFASSQKIFFWGCWCCN